VTSPGPRVESFDLVVIGAGPVGMLAALAQSAARRVLVVADRVPGTRPTHDAVVESLPLASLLNLQELGIDPGELGAGEVHRARTVAWDDARPVTAVGPPVVHIERSLLEAALWRRVAARRVRVQLGRLRAPRADAGWRGESWRAERAIDASGRRAVTAARRRHPPERWAARLWSLPLAATRVSSQLALAATRDGYVYRLGSAHTLTVAVVTPIALLPPDLASLAARLAADAAAWVLDGVPLDAARPVGTRVASVEWPDDDAPATVLRAGDAALARDALSSQGLATGFVDAWYAAAADAATAPLVCARQRHERARHLATLERIVSSSRWGAWPAWRTYGEWIARAVTHAPPAAIALRGGSIVATPDTVY
jgi:2-polyprenyl-6-methoxyphenol hydroxylase-like FAD-dependent oxidoreductase